MELGFLPINKNEIDKCRENLFFNEYYDVEKLNYMIYRKDDKYDKNCEFSYLEYINEPDYNQQLEKGIEYYKLYRQDIPFINDIAMFIVRSELENPITKKEIKKIKNKILKDKLEQRKLENKRLKRLKKLEKTQVKIEKKKVLVEFE